MQSLEGQFDSCTEQLFEATVKLEQKEKAFSSAEGDVGGLARRALLIEEEVERSEERLAKAVTELAKHSQRADKAIKERQKLENLNSANEEQGDKLEGQLKEDKFTMAESERKYEDIARKLATMEEELRVVGQNLQQLEVSEEKALQREEKHQNQIKNLADSLKVAENREENATMNIQRLNIRIDQIEEDLLSEKLKIKSISDDLDGTFTTMLGMAN